MMCANDPIHYNLMVVFIRLHIALPHYDLSEGIELLKCLSGTFCLKCVSKINWNLSIIFHEICGAVYIRFTHFSYDNCENICTYLIIIIKSEVWPICHCLGLGQETMVYAACLFIFLLNEFGYGILHQHTIITLVSRYIAENLDAVLKSKDMYLVYLSFIKLNSPWNKMMVTQQLITSQVFSWEHFCIGF